MQAFLRNKDKVFGQVRLVARNADTFGRDLHELTAAKLSFAQGLNSPKFSIMARQRLKIVRDDVFDQLKTLDF